MVQKEIMRSWKTIEMGIEGGSGGPLCWHWAGLPRGVVQGGALPLARVWQQVAMQQWE